MIFITAKFEIRPEGAGQWPRIINATVPQDDWSLLGEMAVPGSD